MHLCFLAVGFYLMRNIIKGLSAGLKVSVTAFNPLSAPLTQLQPVTFRVGNATVCFRRLTGRTSQLPHDRAPLDIQQSSKLFPPSVGVTTSGQLCPTCHFSFPLAALRHRTFSAGNLLSCEGDFVIPQPSSFAAV